MTWMAWLQLMVLLMTFSLVGGIARAIVFDELSTQREKTTLLVLGLLLCAAQVVLLVWR